MKRSTGSGWLAMVVISITFTGSHAQDAGALEARMLVLLNRDRAAQGLPALTADADLAEVARGHSREMVTAGYFAHLSPTGGALRDRLGRAGIRWARAGENIAQDLTLEGAAASLLASPSHRVNILSSDFTHVGVGIVRKGPWLYVTQDFMRRPSSRRDQGGSREEQVAAALPPVPMRAEFLGGSLRSY